MSSDAGIPQPTHVSLRIEYEDGHVHEFAIASPEKVRVDVALPAAPLAFTKDLLRENPYVIPQAVNRTRRVDISLEAAPMAVEQVQIRDSRVTITARQALEAFRRATGWSDEEAFRRSVMPSEQAEALRP